MQSQKYTCRLLSPSFILYTSRDDPKVNLPCGGNFKELHGTNTAPEVIGGLQVAD